MKAVRSVNKKQIIDFKDLVSQAEKWLEMEFEDESVLVIDEAHAEKVNQEILDLNQIKVPVWK